MRHDDDRSAALVIRAWHEPGTPPEEIRARLTLTADNAEAGSFETVARGEDAILDAVRDWLRAFRER
jgi:hypothetical protein